MKDAVITVRLTRAMRKQLERLAQEEGRSLSAEVGQLLDRAIEAGAPRREAHRGPKPRSLSGLLRGGRTPTLQDFRAARRALSGRLGRRTDLDGEPGR